jgi:hypothetical protein
MGKLKSVEELFKGRHFDRGIVILCVRWYLRFKLTRLGPKLGPTAMPAWRSFALDHLSPS